MSKIRFSITDEFEREFKRLKRKYRSLPDDIRQCQAEIEKNPNTGAAIVVAKAKERTME